MGFDSDVESRMETVAKRVEFLEVLGEGGPMPPRDIVEAVDYSRPTVTRALRELREADLVEQDDGGYSPTLAGVMAADEYRRYETASKAIFSTDDLLAPIPEAHAPPVEALVGADAITAETTVPVHALETVTDRVQRAETIRAYLPTLVNTHLLRVWHRAVIATSVESGAIFDPDLLTVLKGQYPHLLSEMAAADGFSAFATSGPPYGFVLTTTDDTTTVMLVVYEGDTALRGILTNDSPAAVEWARAEFERLADDATEVTADLDALSAAVADGLTQSRHGSTAPRSSGDAPARATDGHSLPIELEADGFVRLSSEYFDTHRQATPAVSWRTGFTLAEIRAGHAVDRLDAEGRNLTQRLLETLQAGTDHVVLGPPGSGKSTVCMAVACEWYDRGLGPVLYREWGDGDHFESPALLEAYLRQTEGHALVVVDDAVREEGRAVFDVMRTLDGDPSVTFLLNARTNEWRDPDTFDLDVRRDAYRRTAVEEITVPDLDEQECERFVTHFSELVDADVDLSGAELFSMIDDGAATTGDRPAGDALVAQHYLARRYHLPDDVDTATVTALDEAVRNTYQTLTDADSPLAPTLAVMVALLTAAGIPVASEYLYAVADAEEFAAVDEALSLLQGRLLFDRDQPRVGSPTTYRTRHETVAMRFLEQFLALESSRRASELVGECVTQLLALADDPARRQGIQRHLDGRTPHLHRIEADPGHWADEIIERLFSIGRTNADLAPLFGDTDDEVITLPAACSGWARLQRAYWRGEMNLTHGDLARAKREFRALGELAGTVDLDPTAVSPATPEFSSGDGNGDVSTHRTRWRATSKLKLGMCVRHQGDDGTAEQFHREALALFREIEDGAAEAVSLKNLGTDAFKQGDYDRATEYFERSLDIARDHDARWIEAASLNNLGTVTQQLGQSERTREYYEESLAIIRELGDRSGEAHLLNNLGTIAREQGEYDRAREYHEESLVRFRDLGNRLRVATNFTNLGTLARKQGEYDRAREYHEESLAILSDLGNRVGRAYSHNHLGTVARKRGEYDRAREYYEESLAIFRDVDDQEGKAYSRHHLGIVARKQGEYDRAREYHEASLATFRELEDRHGEAPTLTQLGAIARERGDYDEAREYYQSALETFEAIGDEDGIATVRLEQGRLALAEDDLDSAREAVVEARGTFEELGRVHELARSRRLLGRLAAAADTDGKAREHWRGALETFEEIGAPQDALAALRHLVETCREQGDDEQAREWCERSRETLAAAPDATAALHRDWVERHATELRTG